MFSAEMLNWCQKNRGMSELTILYVFGLVSGLLAGNVKKTSPVSLKKVLLNCIHHSMSFAEEPFYTNQVTNT
jgi:hypothetical protein